tara:strand:+ start:418 stop:1341 length:924 start_codon:yes stop_codon:yes gene_type:complete
MGHTKIIHNVELINTIQQTGVSMPFLTSNGISELETGKTLNFDDYDIHYHELGSGDPVLFLHSYGPGSTGWLTFHKVLGALSQNHRCIVMDLANYGGTGPIEYNEPVHSVHARVAKTLLDSLGIDQVTLIGNSVGATTSMVFTLENPGRVKRLIIGGCHASTGGDPYVIANYPSEGLRVTQATYANPTDDALRWYLKVHLDNQSLITDELFDYVKSSLNEHPEYQIAQGKSFSVPHSNLGELANIQVPTLIIHGRFDRMVTVEQALTIMGYLPECSRLVVLNNCGHWPPFEQPDLYIRYAMDFLKEG